MTERNRGLHGYVSKNEPYRRPSERSWRRDIDGSNGLHEGGSASASVDEVATFRGEFEVASIARVIRPVPRIDSTGGA